MRSCAVVALLNNFLMRANHRAPRALQGLSAPQYSIGLSSVHLASIQAWEMDTAASALQAMHVGHQYSLQLPALQVPIQERGQPFAQSAPLAPPAPIRRCLLNPVRTAPIHRQMVPPALPARSKSSARVSRPSRAILARAASTRWVIRPHAPRAQLATTVLLAAKCPFPARLATSVSVPRLLAHHAHLGIIARILARSLNCALKGNIPLLAPWSAVNARRGKAA